MTLTLTNELIEDMPEQDYHDSTGVGPGKFRTRSMVQCYMADRPLYKHRFIDQHPAAQIKKNDGMRFGEYVEDCILDGDVSAYVKQPDKCWSNSKNCEVDWNLRSGQHVIHESGTVTGVTTKEWADKNPKIIDSEQELLAEFLILRFMETRIGKWWMDTIPESKKQVVLRWADPDTGLPMQARIDNLYASPKDARAYQCDLKSTASSLDKWNGICKAYGYDLQNVIYSDGYTCVTGKTIPFFNAVGETGGLKRARIMNIPQMQRDHVRKKYRAALAGIKAENYLADDHDSTSPQINDPKAWELYEYESED